MTYVHDEPAGALIGRQSFERTQPVAHDGSTIVSARWGHAAKFKPRIGELVAAVATGIDAGVPDRFRVGAAKAPVHA